MRYKDTWTPATVKEKHEAPRSYVVENSYGQTYRRNRKHLRQTKANFPTEMSDTEISIPSPPSSSQTRENDSQMQQHAGESADSSVTPERTTTETTDTPTSPYKTRSGRSVVMPQKYKDYVM